MSPEAELEQNLISSWSWGHILGTRGSGSDMSCSQYLNSWSCRYLSCRVEEIPGCGCWNWWPSKVYSFQNLNCFARIFDLNAGRLYGFMYGLICDPSKTRNIHSFSESSPWIISLFPTHNRLWWEQVVTCSAGWHRGVTGEKEFGWWWKWMLLGRIS